MPVYHFHIRGAGLDFRDEEGAVCRDDVQAHAQASWVAREALLDSLEDGHLPRSAVVEVVGAAGGWLLTVPVWLSIPAGTRDGLARTVLAERRRRER